MTNPIRTHALAALLCTAGLPLAALAQNASTAGVPELYPTINSVGVRLPYTGDSDADAVAHLEWRPLGQSLWRRGVDLTRIANQRWAGSVLWLAADTPVEVRAVIEDPDGGSSAEASARTRAEPSTVPTGRTWWVATDGSDANAGTAGAPLATLQAAADRAGPGEEIRVRAGLYHQTVRCTRTGTAAALIHLVADAPGVILDGSDPALLQRSDWRDDGGGIWSIPFTGVTRLVCADSLQRLYRQSSLASLQSNADGMTQGWAAEGGRLYAKLEDGTSPNGHVMHVARFNDGITLEADFWRVNGFEVRYFGIASSPAPGAILVQGASGCVVQDNHCHTLGGDGVVFRPGSDDNIVERNLCRDPRIGGWPWTATKGHTEEIQGISVRGGRGNVIRHNTCTGVFDGIDTGDGVADENIGADLDVHDNLVTHVADDALEPEGIAGINTRLWHNRVDAVYDGCSIAGNTQGPTYVLYNTFTNYARSAFKFSNSSTGQNWFCHNTVTTTTAGKPALWGTGPYSNDHFRNNILTGNATTSVDDDNGESQTGNDFDGDLLYAPGSGILFRWKGVNYATVATLRSGTGFETHGRSGDPLFVSPATGDYGLLPGSPALDGGVALPGINDCWTGAGPDVGAGEFCGPDSLTAVEVSLAAAEARPGLVTVTWYATAEVGSAIAYRSAAGAAWLALGTLYPDGTGKLVLEDRDVAGGVRYGYRLGVTVDGAEQFFGETWVDAPSGLALALAGARPNPTTGDLVMAFTLPDDAGGRLEVVDVSGRRVFARSLAGLPAGNHLLRLDADARLAPGLYLLRLSHGGRALTSRACVIR